MSNKSSLYKYAVKKYVERQKEIRNKLTQEIIVNKYIPYNGTVSEYMKEFAVKKCLFTWTILKWNVSEYHKSLI